jgi:tetratricopeptide (TPR) repeat protein
MRTKLMASLLACVTAFTAVAGDGVDREKLQHVVELPVVGENDWLYKMSLEGRVDAVDQRTSDVYVAEVSTELAGNETDAERWMALARVCRLGDDVAQAEYAAANAIAIFRRRCAERPDDGRPLASLGLALVASGDDKGGEAAIGAAGRAKDAAWAGTAAAADLLVLRAAGRVAGRRLATLYDVFDAWLLADATVAKRFDAVLLDDAASKYDAAVAALESSGGIGQEASSVYARRKMFCLLRAMTRGIRRDDSLAYEERKAAAMQPSDPYAIVLIALDEAMSGPDAEGYRRPERFEELSDAARANVTVHLARLREMAASPDAATSARALQAIAYFQWTCVGDAAATEASLRRSIEKDPRLPQSWVALTMVLGQAQRWDDIVQVCRDRIAKTGDSARKRLMLGKALALTGHDDDAEKEWRAGLALDPKNVVANLGVAALVIRRAKDDADLREAADLVRAAKQASKGTKDPSMDAACRLWDAVLMGLNGDVDGAEKIARRLVAEYRDWQPGKDLLAALGR